MTHDPRDPSKDSYRDRDAIDLLDEMSESLDEQPHRAALELERRLSEAESVPTELLRARFYRSLAQAELQSSAPSVAERVVALWHRLLPSQPGLQMAAAAGMVVVALVAGIMIGSRTTDPNGAQVAQSSAAGERRSGDEGLAVIATRDAAGGGATPTAVQATTAQPAEPRNPDDDTRVALAQLQQDLRNTQQILALSLLDNPSASERLRGVSVSSRSLDNERILAALLDALHFDDSENVRLAALEALSTADHGAQGSGGPARRPAAPVFTDAPGRGRRHLGGHRSTRRVVMPSRTLLTRSDLDDGVRRHFEDLIEHRRSVRLPTY